MLEKYPLIDTHCHLDVERFDADRDAVLQRAFDSGVRGIVIPAIGPDAWDKLLTWPICDKRVQVGLGIHPQMLPQLPAEDDELHLERLDELLAHKTAIAVGECGLDGGTTTFVPMERQVHILEEHFQLAKKHQLPLLIHCLHAHDSMRTFLQKHASFDVPMLMHSYSGSAEITPFYVSMGCHFSFAGPITFVGARKPVEALKAVPLDRLMIETDAPDQSPHPHRGGRNEPARLHLIAAGVARALGLTVAEVAELTVANSMRFFPAFKMAS